MRGTLQQREEHFVGLSHRRSRLQARLPTELGNEAIDERDLSGEGNTSLFASRHGAEGMAHLVVNMPGEQDIRVLGVEFLALDELGRRALELTG
ncbi:hypothetical protein [Hyalangium gracile]|uniref:hypothetical protein n=1 Tax=Hyalangium gracile TaxID=394092 RepID=UPI001CCCBF92|nr:hypothetical protein [Hyalangium gracile]